MPAADTKDAATSSELPAAILSRNPLSWLVVFGPGAVIASLTIGTGELIFASRGGALFGSRVLAVFALVCALKWALVFASARHIVLTGAHPFERWTQLPGPRGWLPAVFLLLAVACIPVWVSFHSGVIGNFAAQLTGTSAALGGGAEFLWGAAVLAGVLVLVAAGGYRALEKVQLGVVVAMILCVAVSLVFLRPDWLELVLGALVPRPLEYLPWVEEATQRAINPLKVEPAWAEGSLYVGVIGGAGYDYLAYASFLREKNWGGARGSVATEDELERIALDPAHPRRRWLRAPLVDSLLSFTAVAVFTAVFAACGRIVLAPRGQVPSDESFLTLQAEFVRALHPVLEPLYVAGALLAMLGTLYGTLEIAPVVLREAARAAQIEPAPAPAPQRLRALAVGWCAACALAILALKLAAATTGAFEAPPLTEILRPANLFTGVLSCGVICALNLWSDWRFLPRALRMGPVLAALNVLAAALFVALGLKGYWDYGSTLAGEALGGAAGGFLALGVLAATLAAGWIAARVLEARGGGTTAARN